MLGRAAVGLRTAALKLSDFVITQIGQLIDVACPVADIGPTVVVKNTTHLLQVRHFRPPISRPRRTDFVPVHKPARPAPSSLLAPSFLASLINRGSAGTLPNCLRLETPLVDPVLLPVALIFVRLYRLPVKIGDLTGGPAVTKKSHALPEPTVKLTFLEQCRIIMDYLATLRAWAAASAWGGRKVTQIRPRHTARLIPRRSSFSVVARATPACMPILP